MLGRLERKYGDDARYVHLTRDPDAVARSFERRWGRGVINAYQAGVLFGSKAEKAVICRDYVDTVTSNIQAFLKDKSHVLEFQLENGPADWDRFWNWAGAEGDYAASLDAWSVRYNASKPAPSIPKKIGSRINSTAKRLNS